MGLERFEIGIVGASSSLVDFYANVFELNRISSEEYPIGTLHRLQSPGAVIKVMVPNEPPADSNGRGFLAVKGLRYLTMFVTDLNGVLVRCVARNGRVLSEPMDFEAGFRLAVIADPDGNAIEVVQSGQCLGDVPQ